jgi:AbrB family looped-hinge helix DNA binding protein
MAHETTKVGKRGTVVIPAALRRRFGLDEGSLVVVEVRDEGLLLRPAVAMPVEIYTPKRRAEFLLTNAVDAEDYARAVDEVRRMGLDPATIPHRPPDEA